MFIPKRYHKLALNRVAQYLKNTQDCDLVLVTNYDIFKVDAYPDVDFAGMYGHKRHNDPTCANIRTGFIIVYSDCPVLWISKLQTGTDLSEM